MGIGAIWLLSFLCLVDEDHGKLATLYWLPKLHQIHFKSGIVKQFMRGMVVICFGLLGFGGMLDGLESKGFLTSGLFSYDFSAICTTITRCLVWEGLAELIDQTFDKEVSFCLA